MTVQNLKNVGDVIEALGGSASISRQLGLKGASTVSEWKRRGSIPVTYWPGLTDLSTRIGLDGLDNDLLVKVHNTTEIKVHAE